MIILAAAVLSAAVSFQLCEADQQKAQCTVISVPENREAPPTAQGRNIGLRVLLVPAKEGARSEDAVFALAGGPGLAASKMTGYAARLFAGTGRDVVLVEMRGTGQSNGLHCDLGGSPDDVRGYFNGFLPLDRVRACREALMPRADLTRYTTRAAADDLEDVRKALGYARVNLYGTSYGTRLALEYMRAYPARVRMAILDGVLAPSMASPASFAPDAQRSLEGVFALCEADADCRQAYPNLRADYRAMLDRIANGLDITTYDEETKRNVSFHIGRGQFAEAFRNFLYAPEVYVRVPLIVHRAAAGDFSEFAKVAFDYARAIRSLDFGLFLSVTCAEDIPRIDLAKARADADGTLLGFYRVEQQVAACAEWPRGGGDPARTEPVVANISTLLWSGEFDPVTPPKYAAEVARTLSHSRSVMVPRGSHSGDTAGCQEAIMREAVTAGSVDGLHTDCVGRSPLPKFVVSDHAER